MSPQNKGWFATMPKALACQQRRTSGRSISSSHLSHSAVRGAEDHSAERDKVHIQWEHWLKMDHQLILVDSALHATANPALATKSKRRGLEIELWPCTFSLSSQQSLFWRDWWNKTNTRQQVYLCLCKSTVVIKPDGKERVLTVFG